MCSTRGPDWGGVWALLGGCPEVLRAGLDGCLCGVAALRLPGVCWGSLECSAGLLVVVRGLSWVAVQGLPGGMLVWRIPRMYTIKTSHLSPATVSAQRLNQPTYWRFKLCHTLYVLKFIAVLYFTGVVLGLPVLRRLWRTVATTGLVDG